MAVKFLSDGHFSGSSTDLTLDGQLFLPSFSNTPGASPTISFDSGSGGISYRNGGGSSDQLWFRAGGSNMGYINTAGIHSSGNLYTANAGDFRNYGGEWHATTGVTGNGFKFTNTADNVDALTISAAGSGVFAGNVTALDITGDNILSTANSGDPSIYINSTRPTLGFTDSNSFTDPNDIYIIRGTSGNALQFQWYDDSAGTHTQTFSIGNTGNASFAGSVTAGSFVKSGGTSSQFLMADGSVSTGGSGITQADADIRYVRRTGGTSSAMSGDLHIISGGPKIYLQDNTDDDDQAIIFRNNGGSDEYKIATQDFTTGGGADGFYIGSTTSDGEVAIVTNSTTAAVFHTNQNVTINGLIEQTDTQGDNSFAGNILLQNTGTPQLRIYRTNGANTKYGVTSSDIGEIGTTSNHSFRLIQNSGAALTIDTSKNATFEGDVILNGTAPTLRIQDSRSLNNPDWDNVSLGNIEFYTSDTTSPGSRVLAEIEAFSNAAAASGPNTELRFKTSTITDSSPQTRLTISHDGSATFAADLTVQGGDIILGGTGRIQGIDTVSAGTDAANKTYVDNAISGITEQDTLDTVADRGAITDNTITVNGLRTNADSTYDIGQNATRFATAFVDNIQLKDYIKNNTAAYINYISNQGHRFYVDSNNDDTSHKFQILSNTSTYAAGNVVFTVDQSGNVISEGSISMNQSNTQVDMTGNSSGNFTIDNNTGSIAFQANGSTVNSMTITSSAITLNENTTVTGTLDPQGNILGAVIDDGNSANPLQVRRSAASTMQVGINFTVSPTSGSGFARYLGVDSSADLRFGSNTNHGTNALVLTTANYVSQFGSFAGDIIPSADSTYDLGSNATKWAEGHFDHLYVGETGNNPRIDIYTESSNNPIADTFAQDTQKSYIYFNAGSGSNDPGYIMHETTGSPEDNEGVLHLVPSDDNSTGDYVSIHGTNDPDAIKLHTNGLIETANYQLVLRSAVGDVYIDDGLTVNGTIAATGGTSTTWNEAHDNMIISASVSGTSTKTITLNQNDGGTITASWSDLQGTTVTAPNAPTNLSLSIVNNTVNVTFDASSTSGIDQYLVFGSANGGDYSLISVIEPGSMGSTMSVIDDSFDDSGAQAYRVYAMKTGVMSSALSGSVTYTVSTPVEPTNMSVVNLNTAFYIQWDPPSSNARFVTAYNVYVHEHGTQGSLSRSSATLIYSGMNTNYMYEISGNNNLNYHQFWVETTVT